MMMSNMSGLCGVNRKDIFVKTCQIHGGQPTRMLIASFVRICKQRRSARYSGCGFGNSTVNPECFACETGALIAAGKDFPRPDNVEWIELDDCGMRIAECGLKTVGAGHARERKPKEIIMEAKNENPTNDNPFKVMPEITDHLRLTDLQTHWRRPIVPDDAIGICVNCGRDEKKIRSVGLCSSCQSATKRKRGQEMLDGLAEARVRLWSKDSLRRAMVQKGRKKRIPKALATRKATVAPAPAPAPALSAPFITDLYRLGQQYKELGEKLMDQSSTINELVAATAQLGLRLDINIEVAK
jgi:hypothetical protein